MPNVKPISDLNNYNGVLRDVSRDKPVFLTRNGKAYGHNEPYSEFRAS